MKKVSMKILKLQDDYFRVENSASYNSKSFTLWCTPTKNDQGEDREPVDDEYLCWAEVNFLPDSMAKIVNEYFGTDFEGDGSD